MSKDKKTEKLVKSINKNVRSSTRKLNPILRSIVGKKVGIAVRDLSFLIEGFQRMLKKHYQPQ